MSHYLVQSHWLRAASAKTRDRDQERSTRVRATVCMPPQRLRLPYAALVIFLVPLPDSVPSPYFHVFRRSDLRGPRPCQPVGAGRWGPGPLSWPAVYLTCTNLRPPPLQLRYSHHIRDRACASAGPFGLRLAMISRFSSLQFLKMLLPV